MMANDAETCSVEKKSEKQPKLNVDGNSDTEKPDSGTNDE
jgi:hypothetical protein